MIIEVLFSEVCGLNGDAQNAAYLRYAMPDAEVIYTSLLDTPYFVENRPDMILLGYMTEATQRRVIEKLMPLKERLEALIEDGVVFLATGNAGEVFCKKINYVTEKIESKGLGIFDLEVKTDLFGRYNGKILSRFEGIEVVGFRTQFSHIYGDNSDCYFAEVIRGIGINPESKLEGMRKNNLLCTHTVGPILPLNPLFCEKLIALAGGNAEAAFRTEAIAAYEERRKEWHDPNIRFDM
ncbi:MAG: hypothetical protein E7461_05855 [Ruminococcaceae bacterium]|nr:hypothetical protein [Oscillospiraceae bacterium]